MNRAMNRRRQSAGITQVRSAGWGLMSSAQHASGHGQNAKTGYGRKRFARRRQDIVIGLLFIGGVIAALAIVAEFGVPWAPRPISSAVLNTADIEDPLIGTLTVQTDENKCELMKFDNETGRTIQNTARCRNDVTMDAHGAPVPVGTVHRLDAISKSFLAGEHRATVHFQIVSRRLSTGSAGR